MQTSVFYSDVANVDYYNYTLLNTLTNVATTNVAAYKDINNVAQNLVIGATGNVLLEAASSINTYSHNAETNVYRTDMVGSSRTDTLVYQITNTGNATTISSADNSFNLNYSGSLNLGSLSISNDNVADYINTTKSALVIEPMTTFNSFTNFNTSIMVHGAVFSSNINLFRNHTTIGDSNFKRVGYGFRMNENDQLELIKVATFNDDSSVTKKIAVFGYNNIDHNESNDTNYMAFDETNGITFAGENNNIANFAFLSTTGGTMTGDINMSDSSIYNASNISAVNLAIQNITSDVNMNNYSFSNANIISAVSLAVQNITTNINMNNKSISSASNISAVNLAVQNITSDINMNNKSINSASNISAVNLTVQNYVVAPGADYAEYVKKEDPSVNFKAGDVVGINRDGQVTNVFANSVHFAIVSTKPSFIGGNPWLSDVPTSPEDPSFAEYKAVMKQYEKIAFCGCVKVNAVNAQQAQPGAYIVPAANGSGLIESTFVGANYMSFAQYVKSVGHIIALDEEQHPIVIVKC